MAVAVQTFAFRQHPRDPLAAVSLPSFVPVEWDNGASSGAVAEPIAPAGSIDYRCTAVLVGEGGSRRESIEVTFTERLKSATHSTLLGSDMSGSLRVRVEAELPPTGARMNFRFKPTMEATPVDLLPSIDFLEAIDPGLRLGLWSQHNSQWAAAPTEIPGDRPTLPDGYASTVRTLARLQRQTGQHFPMPAEITPPEAEMIGTADALISGQLVTGTWTDARLSIDRAGLDVLQSASEESVVLFEFSTEFVLVIAGRRVDIGFVQVSVGAGSPDRHRALGAR